MSIRNDMRLIAVYDTDDEARNAVHALERSGVDAVNVRIADARDHLSAVEGEMRSETTSAVAGSAIVGPLTREMARGGLLGIVVGALVGLLVALPLAFIEIGGLARWVSALLVLGIGAIVGATAGWVVAGSFAAKRPDEPLAAERGTTVAVPLSDVAQQALVSTNARRIDIVEADGHPVSIVAERAPAHDRTMREIARHMRTEGRRG